MDQQLRLNILNNVVGAEKVDELKVKLVGLNNSTNGIGKKLMETAAGTYLFEKGFELASKAVESFKEVIEIGDHLAVLSEKTGIAAQTISQFEEAAKQSAVPVETLEKGLKKFTQSLGDVNNEKFRDAVKAMGISVTDTAGRLKASDVVLKEVSNKFEAMQDGPGKAALAVQLFGKSGSDLIPVLNLGSAEIEKYGLKMGKEFPERAKQFNDTLEETKKLMAEQKIALIEDVLPAMTSVVKAWNDVSKMQASSPFGDQTIQKIGEWAAAAYTAFKYVVDALDNIFTHVRAEIEYISTLLKEIGNIATFNFKDIAGDWNKGSENIAKLNEEFKKRAAARQLDVDTFNDSIAKGPPDTQERKGGKAAPSVVDKKYENEANKLAKYALAQSEVINKEALLIDNYDLSTSALQKLTLAQEIRTQAQKETVGWETSAKQAYLDTAEAVIKQRQALIDLQEQQKQTFTVGAKLAFRDYVERLKDVSTQTREMFTRAFNNMEDALVNFVKTGKMNFKDFANAIIDDLIRIAVRQATLGVLVSAGFATMGTASSASASSGGGTGYLGANTSFSANGNVIGAGGPKTLSYFANGGVVNTPHVAVFGEGSTPEAFVPLPDGRTIPVTLKGAGKAQSDGGVTIQIVINPTTGEQSVSGTANNPNYDALANVMASVAKTEIVKQMRPGGLLARV